MVILFSLTLDRDMLRILEEKVPSTRFFSWLKDNEIFSKDRLVSKVLSYIFQGPKGGMALPTSLDAFLDAIFFNCF